MEIKIEETKKKNDDESSKMEHGRNEPDISSAAGMSVSGHVDNQSRLQVGITEANATLSRGFPVPTDP